MTKQLHTRSVEALKQSSDLKSEQWLNDDRWLPPILSDSMDSSKRKGFKYQDPGKMKVSLNLLSNEIKVLVLIIGAAQKISIFRFINITLCCDYYRTPCS